MEIVTVWITRHYSQDTPEMVEAWSEFDIDANYEGWCEARDKAVASIGDDLHTVRVINVHVDYDEIRRAFDDVDVDASRVEVQ